MSQHSENAVNIECNEEKAARERLWSHTVGIANGALVTHGKDPGTGLPAREEQSPGTGCAGAWGDRHFILTARHVVENAQPSDLSFFVRMTGELKTQHASSITRQDLVTPVSLNDQTATIHRCDWEDLAILSISREALGATLEFFDMVNLWVDPPEGATVAGVGYPVSNSVIFEERRSSSVIEKSVVLSPTPFSGVVMPTPSPDELRFKVTSFDCSRHYLIPYEPAKEGKHPRGISGAAVWVESAEEHHIWAPRFKFAGTCTVCYESGTKEQIVKASAVRRFLLEVLGPPDS